MIYKWTGLPKAPEGTYNVRRVPQGTLGIPMPPLRTGDVNRKLQGGCLPRVSVAVMSGAEPRLERAAMVRLTLQGRSVTGQTRGQAGNTARLSFFIITALR